MKVFENLSVGRSMQVIAGVALAGLLLFATMSLTTLSTVKVGGPKQQAIAQQNELIADILPPPAYLVEAHLQAFRVKNALATGNEAIVPEKLAELDAMIDEFNVRQAHWEETIPGTEELRALNDAETVGLEYIDVLESQFVPAAQALNLEGIEAVLPQLDDLFAEHRVEAVETVDIAAAEAARVTAEGTDLAQSRFTQLIGLLIATLVIAGGVAWLVIRSVMQPLNALRSGLKEIAHGDADSAHRLDEDREDEFGEVAKSFNAFADRIADEAVAAEQSALAAEQRAQVIEDSAGVAAENINQVAAASGQLSAAASEIAKSAGDASRTAETAVFSAQHANELMSRLSDSSARISEVVEAIRGIAAQTTMLALNATIEAARAGEAGRGFAVVASEVKDLAAETGAATSDIVSRVDDIHNDTQAALAALGEVTEVISEISSSQSVIAAAVEEQAATTSEIDRGLREAVGAVAHMAQQDDVGYDEVVSTSDDDFVTVA